MKKDEALVTRAELIRDFQTRGPLFQELIQALRADLRTLGPLFQDVHHSLLLEAQR